ncbi:DNA alkylation repair protein [candidate division KSB1 bacterium]
MSENLKDMFYTESSINSIADVIKKYYPEFDKEKFLSLIYDDTWKDRELKQKMHHLTIALNKTLPSSYTESLEILKKTIPYIKGFEVMSWPDYVELYGIDDWENSLPALAFFTKFASAEFAVRPFIAKDPERMMKFMRELADDGDHKVRRLASEGCRPRLPWAMALPVFKKDPSLILPILEKLKKDESDSVRRSVANNLNDISKDNPEIVLNICEKWAGQSKDIDAIVKHACRTMLKNGNKRVMMLFGYVASENINVENLSTDKNEVVIGEKVQFFFDLVNMEKKSTKIRIEYAVYYAKSKGKISKKVFQLTEKTYKPGNHAISKNHSFEEMSTRKHYEGKHDISVIVNGVEKAKTSLILKK